MNIYNEYYIGAFSLNAPLASTINCGSKHISSDSNSKTTKYMKNSKNIIPTFALLFELILKKKYFLMAPSPF
jgi:hypothetical protein